MESHSCMQLFCPTFQGLIGDSPLQLSPIILISVASQSNRHDPINHCLHFLNDCHRLAISVSQYGQSLFLPHKLQ